MSKLTRRARAIVVEKALLFGRGMYGMEWLTAHVARLDGAPLRRTLIGAGAQIHPNAVLRGNMLLDNAVRGTFANLVVGRRASIGRACFFDLVERIEIHDEVALGPQVMILTHASTGGRPLAESYPRKAAPVRLMEGCWLGARVVVLPGVTIGEGSVVAAGAVVTSDVPARTVVAGVPAKPVKTIEHPSELALRAGGS